MSLIFNARIVTPDWALAAVAAYVLLIPLALTSLPNVTPHDAARVMQCALFTLCAFAMVVHCWRHRQGIGAGPHTEVNRWMIGAGICAGVSVIAAPLPLWAMREVALWVGMAFVAWTVAVAGGAARRRVFEAALLATLAYNALVLGISLTSIFAGQVPWAIDLELGYSNVRFLNHVQTVMIPFAVAGALQVGLSVRRQAILDVTLASTFALLFASGGRATALAIAMGAALAWFAARTATGSALRRLGRTAVWGYLTYVAIFLLLPSALGLGVRSGLLDRAGETGSVTARLYLWRLAVEQIGLAPWFGIGPMHFAHHPNREAAHPHNAYLQLAVEVGVPFFLLAMGGLWMMGRAWVARIRSLDRIPAAEEGAAWLVCLLAVLFDAMASGNLVMPVSQVWIALAVGFSIRWWWSTNRANLFEARPPTAGHRFLPFVCACVGASLSVWLLLVSVSEIGRLDETLKASRELSPTAGRINPRYWSSGWF